MDFAIYEQLSAAGEGRTVPISKVAAVVRGVPDGTTVDEVIQRLFSSGRVLSDAALIAPEPEWPSDVQRMITRGTDSEIETLSWDRLN